MENKNKTEHANRFQFGPFKLTCTHVHRISASPINIKSTHVKMQGLVLLSVVRGYNIHQTIKETLLGKVLPCRAEVRKYLDHFTIIVEWLKQTFHGLKLGDF